MLWPELPKQKVIADCGGPDTQIRLSAYVDVGPYQVILCITLSTRGELRVYYYGRATYLSEASEQLKAASRQPQEAGPMIDITHIRKRVEVAGLSMEHSMRYAIGRWLEFVRSRPGMVVNIIEHAGRCDECIRPLRVGLPGTVPPAVPPRERHPHRDGSFGRGVSWHASSDTRLLS